MSVAPSQPPPDAPLAFRVQHFVESLQNEICRALEEEDGRARFRRDRWAHPEGGGGVTAVIEDGEVFEKGGVNTSAVRGTLPERMAEALNLPATAFFATGLSLVLHPRSPYIPTVHANFRYFALGADLASPDDQWFGGGADLTPYYPFLEDARHFHATWKGVCDQHPPADYARFKKACDDYFFLPHRGEARGVGGIFYDYLRGDPTQVFAFMREAGRSFLPAYRPIVQRRRGQAYGERERAFQLVRRGRYVEFNLLFDRGTRFGIDTGGRTESILMSLPPEVRWPYASAPAPGTREARAAWFFTPREWLDLGPGDGPGISENFNDDVEQGG